MKCYPWDDRLLPNGSGQSHVTCFTEFFVPNHIFGVGETRHFKCRVLIDTEMHYCNNDRSCQKGCVQGRVTSKFWEISDNIWETMQDGCNGSVIENRMWPIKWQYCQCP